MGERPVSNWFGTVVLLFAQADGQQGTGFSWISILTIWVPIGFLFYFLLIRPQRQESSRREAMIRALKPNDHVLTAAGIYGVVTNVHREANAVTIRVDENNNTRIKVALSAVSRVLSDEPSGAATPK
jgi:preprotein translocase subunit YajC